MREPIPTWMFSLVVVRLGRRFLLVHERKHGQGWYLPAGRVEAGETFAQAALRETKEEAGIDVVLEGILAMQHTPLPASRLRVFFVARPLDDTPPKSAPDEHSLEAGWFSVDEMARLSLRGDEVVSVCSRVLEGAPLAPVSLLSDVAH